MTDRYTNPTQDRWATFRAAGLAMSRTEALDGAGEPMIEGVTVERTATMPSGEVISFQATPLMLDGGETVILKPIDSNIAAQLMPSPAKNGTVFRAF